MLAVPDGLVDGSSDLLKWPVCLGTSLLTGKPIHSSPRVPTAPRTRGSQSAFRIHFSGAAEVLPRSPCRRLRGLCISAHLPQDAHNLISQPSAWPSHRSNRGRSKKYAREVKETSPSSCSESFLFDVRTRRLIYESAESNSHFTFVARGSRCKFGNS